MDLLISFLIFILCMTAALLRGLSMLLPLGLGFVLFVLMAVRRGAPLKKVLGFAGESLKESFIVVGILLLIGCLTGLWRLSGTVAYFVTFGVSAIPPQLFLPAAFLLASVMSYALGTSFGVSATAGVILMSIAKAGGADPVLAAGAILSGVYVGDRGSPAASSGNLVAVLTHTDMRSNVRKMLKCSVFPFLICFVVYGILSYISPMHRLDTSILKLLRDEFDLHWLCLVPAVLMIALPFCGLNIKWSMAVSLISSAAVAIWVQHSSISECLGAMVMGFRSDDPALSEMLSGGGILSMLEVCGILVISCSYGSIFKGTGLLDGVNRVTESVREKIGRFPTMILLAFAVSAVFCNQTIGAIMQSNLSSGLYGDSEEEQTRKMLDMENSVITLAGMVPWCIACSVPLKMLGADARTIPLMLYLWLVPLWWLIRTWKENRKCVPAK